MKVGKFMVFTLQQLGKGGFGTVYKAQQNSTYYACKEIKIHSNQMFRQIVGELSIMSMIKHRNLVQMEDFVTEGSKVYIFMELCEQGNLTTLIMKPGILQEELGINVFRDIMEGLGKLQEHNTIHRDIKPHNILISGGVFKLSDFGLSKIVNDLDNQLVTSYYGTPFYCSPQILKGQPYTAKTDIWSFGVTIYEVTFGHLPFRARNQGELLKAIANTRLHISLNIIQNDLLKTILTRMIVENEKDRISFKELQQIANPKKQIKTQNSTKINTQINQSSELQIQNNQTGIQKPIIQNWVQYTRIALILTILFKLVTLFINNSNRR